MPTKFSNYNPNVKGYMLRTSEMINSNQEQLFARFEDGKILTCIKPFSTSFHEQGIEWKETNTIPNNATFIGKYNLPL